MLVHASSGVTEQSAAGCIHDPCDHWTVTTVLDPNILTKWSWSWTLWPRPPSGERNRGQSLPFWVRLVHQKLSWNISYLSATIEHVEQGTCIMCMWLQLELWILELLSIAFCVFLSMIHLGIICRSYRSKYASIMWSVTCCLSARENQEKWPTATAVSMLALTLLFFWNSWMDL